MTGNTAYGAQRGAQNANCRTLSPNVGGDVTALTVRVTALEGGPTISDETLIVWTAGEAFQLTSTTVNSDGIITIGVVLWPDGSSGTYTQTAEDTTWFVTNSYTITHTLSGKTVTQSLVTRDPSTGAITIKPALTIA